MMVMIHKVLRACESNGQNRIVLLTIFAIMEPASKKLNVCRIGAFLKAKRAISDVRMIKDINFSNREFSTGML